MTRPVFNWPQEARLNGALTPLPGRQNQVWPAGYVTLSHFPAKTFA